MKKILNSQFLSKNSPRLFSILNSEHGQVVLVLILVMTVALAIGISVIQRSLSDISTSSKVEQSSRAFSAAEAGIEKAIQADSTIPSFDLGNNATLQGVERNTVPAANQALEYPPLAKEDLAQVWLADPTTLNNSYTQTSLEVYWGSILASGREQPALEIKIIYQGTDGLYHPLPFYIDPVSGAGGRADNNFQDPSIYSGGCSGYSITTSLSPVGATNDRSFKCKITLTGLPNSVTGLPKLILLRGRILYSSASQPFAVKPTSTGSLPVQARLFTATGVSGQTQRKVQVFRLDKVVPQYFDYAIFSAGDINK